MNKIKAFVQSPFYWLAVIAVGFGLEGVALFYQHVLNEPPCNLCIQARVWTLLGIIAAGLGLAVRRFFYIRMAAHLAVVVSLIGLLNRSWIAMLVERGQYEGTCGMDPGFPTWLPLDKWFPNVFEVWTMCGYTPNFIFGLTMAEGLVYGVSILLFVAIAAGLVDVLNKD
ncbi:disulfide bond formation protein B [Reinekea sp.]|jgi:disulfide bond formation protein DsbB|uniref:disulfide bond formation protein B n=1 Tax=Reinekea sp. TaxID=1970455 RepID=UPI003988A56B